VPRSDRYAGLSDGLSAAEDESKIDQRVEDSLISRSFIVNEKRGVGFVATDRLEALFYTDCSRSDVAPAGGLMRPEKRV
jgi:hypothetical protein